MKSALGLAVALDVPRERAQRGAAERVEGASLRGRREPGDDVSLVAKRGEAVADALFDARYERMNRLAQVSKQGSRRRPHGRQVRVDRGRALRRRSSFHGHGRDASIDGSPSNGASGGRRVDESRVVMHACAMQLARVLALVLLAACATTQTARISQADAERLALTRAPGGTVQQRELEKENGRLVWSFDIATPGTSDVTEVQIDAVTGAVVGR